MSPWYLRGLTDCDIWYNIRVFIMLWTGGATASRRMHAHAHLLTRSRRLQCELPGAMQTADLTSWYPNERVRRQRERAQLSLRLGQRARVLQYGTIARCGQRVADCKFQTNHSALVLQVNKFKSISGEPPVFSRALLSPTLYRASACFCVPPPG